MSGTSLSSTFTLNVSNAIASMVMAGKATETEAERMKRVLKQVGQQMDYLAKATKDVSAANEGPKQGAANMERYAVASRQARVEANMLTQANRNLGYQITDIGTSLAGGMPWHLILIQQGGQIKDAYGGIIPALRGILGLVTPVGVALAASAAAVGGLVAALHFGAKESDAFQKALALVGNTTGTTEGHFNGLIKTMQQGRGSMAGDVRAVMQSIVESGQATSTTFESMGRATLSLTKLNGQSAAENVKVFAGIADGVTDWATKANKAYNFLTVEQYKQIAALEAQGRTSEAARMAMDLLNTTLESRTAPVLGVINNLLKDGSEWFSKWWESAKGAGRAETVEERMAALQARLEKLRKPITVGNFTPASDQSRTGQLQAARDAPAIKAAEAEIESLRQESFRNAERALNDALRIEQNKDDILKASRQYQDALATITRAGQERVFAELTNGMDRTEQAVKAAYASGITNGQQYRDAMYLIAKQRLADEITLAQQQVAIEAKRPVKTELETRAKEGAVAGAENKLIGLQGKGQKLDADYLSGDGKAHRDAMSALEEYNAVSDEMALTKKKLTENQKWEIKQLEELDKRTEKLTATQAANERAKILAAAASRTNAEAIVKAKADEDKAEADRIKKAVANTERLFKRTEDMLINFAKTGKLAFSDLFSFMAEEFLREQIRMALNSKLTDKNGVFSLSSLWNAATSLFTPKANGMDYVPYNNYPAMLHEGERVLTRQDAANGAAYGKGENITISHGDLHVGQGVSRGEVAAALKIQQASTVELIRRRDRTGRWA